MPDLAALLPLLRLALKDRQQLVLENIALRHQLAVYKRSVKRPRIEDRDRFFWLAVMRMLTQQSVIVRILEHLKLDAHPPPILPARAPPQLELASCIPLRPKTDAAEPLPTARGVSVPPLPAVERWPKRRIPNLR